jgi:pimeloyl-ACP methyl ester carboxylesterase
MTSEVVVVPAGPDAVLSVTTYGRTGEPVVLIPSLCRGGRDFEEVSTTLEDAAFRCVTIDPRGVGESVGPLCTSLHDYANDVAKVIEVVCGTRAHLVGHAYGGAVARCVAADHPGLVRSLVLLGSGGLIGPEPPATGFFKSFFDPGIPYADRLSLLGEAFFARPEFAAEWMDGWWPQVQRDQRAMYERTPLDDWWSAGTVEMLVVQGVQDHFAPRANGHAAVSSFKDRATRCCQKRQR